MTKMFYVCLRSNKRVERPSQPKLYSVSKLFRFRWAVFSLVYNLWNNKKRNTNWLGQVETLLRALLDDNFVFVPVFCILRKIQKQGRKSIKTLSVFFTFEMRGLGNGSRCSVSGNKYFTAGNANKHWAAIVLYLMVIFQFIKLEEEIHSSQISWYFNRHNISPTCINVFLNNKLGSNSCSVNEYLKMLGSFSF